MTINVQKASITTAKLKILVYGEPGVGKTVFASTFPKPLILDVEGGTLSIADKDVDIVKIKSSNDLWQAYEYLAFEKHPYQSVVVDSLTEAQQVDLNDVIEKAKMRDPGKDINHATQDDYGRNTRSIRRLCHSLRNLDLHVLFTCLVRKDVAESGDILHSPQLPPALANFVGGFVDLIGYFYTKPANEEDKPAIRRLLLNPLPNYVAKDRSGGKLGTYIENPTFQIIWDKLTKQKEGGK